MTHFTTTVVGSIMRPRHTVTDLQSSDHAFQAWNWIKGPRMPPGEVIAGSGAGGAIVDENAVEIPRRSGRQNLQDRTILVLPDRRKQRGLGRRRSDGGD